MARGVGTAAGGFPTPGPAVRATIFGLFAIWLTFAIAINWGGASPHLFQLFCGNTEAILSGEVWRLFTAGFMHSPDGIWHIVFACIGLYFLTPSLEEQWGAGRTVRFLLASSVISYALQSCLQLALPASVAGKLVGPYWFGSNPVLEAIAIAWASSFRGRTVRLFFVLPVTSRGLILFVVGFSVLRLIAPDPVPEGLLAPFGGMFAGWLLGSSTPSPLRRLYLRLRLAQLDRESAKARERRKQRRKASSLRVIDGGKSDEPKSGPDGKYLN